MNLVSAAEAVKLIKSGDSVFIQGSTSIPEVLVQAMTDRAPELRDVKVYSAFAIGSFSVSYRIFEQFDRLWPQLADYPLLAAVLGAVFVGVGTGICIRAGAAICGDDALAMCISHPTKMNVQWAYLITDAVVLGLSATYIPIGRLWYSIVTVVLSGQIIGFIQRIGTKKKEKES